MKIRIAAVAMGISALGALGCHSDKPHDYGQARPPVDQLDDRDRGLQSKDVVSATDQLAQDLLASPELNASENRWTMVVTNVDNQTHDTHFSYNIFTERLKVNLAKYGGGRVALIENKAKLEDLQRAELDPGARPADFGQGPGQPPGTNGIQPNYALYGKIMEMPNRGTSYYFCEFTVTNLASRQIVWTRSYEVKVER